MTNICHVCGRDDNSKAELCPWCYPDEASWIEAESHSAARVQDGLGAAGFLLLAEGHLTKARGLLPFGKPYDQDHHRQLLLYEAADNMQYVRKLLSEKEE